MTEKNSKPATKKKLTKSKNEFPVVGIGASAGGLAAFRLFIKSIPEDSGMAYVLVQHLDPSHESQLPEILQKTSRIPVSQISNDVKVKPDHIYIIPSNNMLISNDGKLELSPRPKDQKSRNLPIDLFFKSLSEVHQSHSIGVVLSGTGFDGTQGLRSIKAYGGITFAQDLESAEYNGMPKNAADAGVVDFVLPIAQIQQKIQEVVTTINGRDSNEKDQITPSQETDDFNQILSLLRMRKGTDFTYYKQTTIQRRILRRVALSNQKDLSKYLKYLREHSEEQEILYKDLLIPVTSFFRDPSVFNNLCNTVLPEILRRKAEGDPIRVWVVGTSTGQEAYTIAMCLMEYLDQRGIKEKVQIFGTDINEQSIATARMGIYKKSELEHLESERLERFFTKVDDTFQVNKQIRELCVFALHNFLKDPPFGKMDLISCRNVLIYMQPYLQKKALTTFHYSLRKKGYLLLGKSESTSSVPELFSPSMKKVNIFTRKDRPGKFMQVTSRKSEENFREHNDSSKTKKGGTDFQKTADDVILSKYTPAGVVVDQHMDIVHFRGSTVNYLEQQPGKPSHNLLKMARNGLALELRTLIHNAKKGGEPVVKENIPIQVNKGRRNISIEAIPLPDLAEPHYLVLFHDRSPNALESPANNKDLAKDSDKDPKDLRIEQLEKELERVRADMRSITEEQEASNEELQSTNEELQSGSEELQTLNEELETSKEELQSTNEELTSANQEQLSLNKHLGIARNFAVDILETVGQPLLVLDNHLRIRSANKAFYRVFRTREEETENKLIYDLGSRQWDIPELRNLLEGILPNESTIFEYEITCDFPQIGQRTMLLNAREIVREEGGEKLILLVFGDITDKRIAEQIIEKSEVKFKLLAETIPQLIWITNATGQFEYFNAQWTQYTGTSPVESMENKWFTFVHPDDLASVLRKWNKSLNSGNPFSMEYRLKNKNGTYNWFLAKALPLFNADGEINKWFGSYTNIETQKEAEDALRKSNEHFRQLAELLPEKVTHADPQGNLNYYNQSWLDYTGLNLQELRRNGWFRIMHPEDRKEVIKRWKKAMKTGENFEMEMRCLNKDNQYKWHLNRTIPVNDENGEIKMWIGATTEIQKIKEEEKRKEGFLKLVSHELKTPVTSIKGYVQLLLSMLKDPKKIPLDSLPLEPSLERIDTQIGRLTRLISEMLDLSRIEENKLELNKENISINELVDETVQDINFTDTDHKIHIRHKYHCNIRADKDRVGQVLINFVTNAIKYSPENKDIEVTIEKALKNQVAVSIRDKGIGIAKRDQKEIFKRFHRIAGKNQETYSGLGIGLFLAHEIIDRHDGEIRVESKLGEGAVFTFTLPFEPDSAR